MPLLPPPLHLLCVVAALWAHILVPLWYPFYKPAASTVPNAPVSPTPTFPCHTLLQPHSSGSSSGGNISDWLSRSNKLWSEGCLTPSAGAGSAGGAATLEISMHTLPPLHQRPHPFHSDLLLPVQGPCCSPSWSFSSSLLPVGFGKQLPARPAGTGMSCHAISVLVSFLGCLSVLHDPSAGPEPQGT